MKTTYLVKKDPSKEGKDNWTIMNSYEFAMFMKTPEGQARKRSFGQLDACGNDDGILIAECGVGTAKRWRSEKDRHDYLKQCEAESNYTTFSYSAVYSEEGEISGEDMLPDKECNIEESVIHQIQLNELREALKSLSPQQQAVIAGVFFSEPAVTEAELAVTLGISQQCVHHHKKMALEKLRKNMNV